MATAAATLAANLSGLWPMGTRINLPLLVLGHLGLINGTLSLVGAGLIQCQMRRADFEGADMGALFAQFDARRGRDELVLLDAATWLNHRRGGSVAEPTALMPPPDPRRVAQDFDPLLAMAGRGDLLIAIGHHNEYHAAVMDQFAGAASSRGSLELAWSGRMVALDRFPPQAAAKAEEPAR
jgi:hypothetical protein